MDVAVIGGGIGGLRLALQLERVGIDCRVYESVPAYSTLGVGFNLFPHAVRRRRLRRPALLDPPRRAPPGHARSRGGPRRACGDVPPLHARRGGGSTRARPFRGRPARPCMDRSRLRRHPLRRAAPAPSPRRTAAFRRDQPVARHHSQRALPRRSDRRAHRRAGARLGDGLPIRNHGDGTQTHNWVAEFGSARMTPNDWNAPGRPEDFIGRSEAWRFDWLDVPDLIRRTQLVLEYPMVDRDPVDRWTVGRTTLLGDAAHPMYPRGGNGAAQAILAGEVLARALRDASDPVAGLHAYEAERWPRTSRVTIVARVEELTGGERFDDIDAVIARDALAAISERCKRLTSGDVQSVNR